MRRKRELLDFGVWVAYRVSASLRLSLVRARPARLQLAVLAFEDVPVRP